MHKKNTRHVQCAASHLPTSLAARWRDSRPRFRAEPDRPTGFPTRTLAGWQVIVESSPWQANFGNAPGIHPVVGMARVLGGEGKKSLFTRRANVFTIRDEPFNFGALIMVRGADGGVTEGRNGQWAIDGVGAARGEVVRLCQLSRTTIARSAEVRVLSLAIALILGTIAAQTVMAQGANQAASTNGITVAVVDVGYILQNHPTMKADIEAIESRMKDADAEMTRKRDAILKQMDQLREKFVEGTPEYEREEKRIAEQDTQFRLEVVRMRKDFDKARANVLYGVYNDIKELIKYVSDQMGIQVVIRVAGTREELDPAKPDHVQMLMSQEVLYYRPNVDLTDWVLQALKARVAQKSGGAQTR